MRSAMESKEIHSHLSIPERNNIIPGNTFLPEPTDTNALLLDYTYPCGRPWSQRKFTATCRYQKETLSQNRLTQTPYYWTTRTHAVGHGVEEDPGSGGSRPALDERHVVTRLDAEHGEQLHLLAVPADVGLGRHDALLRLGLAATPVVLEDWRHADRVALVVAPTLVLVVLPGREREKCFILSTVTWRQTYG